MSGGSTWLKINKTSHWQDNCPRPTGLLFLCPFDFFFFFSIKREKISFCFFPSPELPQPQSCLASVQEPQRLCRHQRSFPKQVSLKHNEIKCLHARTNTARTVSTLWGGKVNRALTTFSVQLGNKSPSNYKVQSVKQRVDVFSLARLCPTLNSLWRFYSQSCFFF